MANPTITSVTIVSDTALKGDPGQSGSAGTAATIAVGSVTSLAPGTPPTITNVGSTSAAIFNFGIPSSAALGTAALLNVSPSGNATTIQVVTGADTRLTDARTPIAHKVSHSSIGSDPIAILKSQVTDFPTIGTSAALNAPGVGDAAVGQVVIGNDSRLTNTRTPVAHQASHVTGADIIPAPTTTTPGLVPALPSSAATTKFYRGDNTFSPIVVAPATLAINAEIWVSLRSDGAAGSGTLADPFDGSTALKFDAIMNAVATFTTVHLAPGVFMTNGSTFTGFRSDGLGWHVSNGVKLIGAGMGATTLRLASIDPASPGSSATIVVSSGGGTGGSAMEVRDMTLDCNYSNLTVPTGNSLDHLYLVADHAKVVNVEFINAYGLFPNVESFSCLITGNNSIVDSCYFHAYHGDYTNGPDIGGSNCFITNCRVEGAGHAYGFSDCDGGVLSHCSSDILTDIAYFIDTGTNSHISIVNNVLRAKTNPIQFNVAVDHILIEGNYIECNNATGATNMAIGLHANSDSMRIANNIYVDSGNQTTGFFKWNAPLSNITVEGNISNVAAYPPTVGDWRLTPGVFSGTNIFGTLDPLSYTRLKDKLTTFTSSLAGIVPASGGGTNKYLRADGTFSTPPGASYSIFSATDAGLVPATASSTINFLRADGTFTAPAGTTYGTVSASAAGLAPILPASAGTTSFLRGDAAWTPVSTLGIGWTQLTGIPSTFAPSAHNTSHVTSGADVIPNFTATASGLVPLSGGGTTNFLRADGSFVAPGSSVPAVNDLTAYDTVKVRWDFQTENPSSDYWHLQGNHFVSSAYSTAAGDWEPWSAQGIIWYSLKDTTNLALNVIANGLEFNPRNDVDIALRWVHNNRDPMSNSTVAQPTALKYSVGFIGPQADVDNGGSLGSSGFGLFYADVVGPNWMLFHNATGGWTGTNSGPALISAGNLVDTGIPFTFFTPYIFRFTLARGWSTCVVQIAKGQGNAFSYTGTITNTSLPAFVSSQAYYFGLAQNGGKPYSATAATNISIIDWFSADVTTRRSSAFSTT